MKRAFTFLFIFTLAASVVFGIIFGFGWNAFDTLFSNKDGLAEGSEWIEKTFSLKGLTEYISENPEHVSVVSYNVNNPDSGIFYNEHTPRTMGTLQNLLLLIEYEKQVEEGKIDPTILVDPDDVRMHAIPEVSEGAFDAVIKNIKPQEQDFIVLDSLVAAMIENSDVAISDWLWFKLGEKNLRELMKTLKLEETDLPIPIGGLYMSNQPNIVSFKDGETSAIEYAEEYAKQNVWGIRVREEFGENRLGISFIDERNALNTFPKTDPLEFTALMASVYKDEVISENVSQRVKEKLGWVNNSEKVIANFSEYGAIYDNRMGLLSGVDFGTSVYDDHTSIQSVFFDSLQVGFYIHMSANHMQEDFQQRLIWDPALFETTKNAISSNE